jgi:prolyl-tRNA synthetase
MLQSQLFLKTQKQAPKDEVFAGTQLLLRAGFIDKLMAGSYTFLPLGFRVLKNIVEIVREEMNKTGANEMLMPLLHPRSIWQDTGRWDTAKEVMFQFEKDGREFGLSFTHEEVVMDFVRKHNISYKDLPIAVYHFSNKFRNEPRPRSGLLRGIEFLMKDLYSLHKSEDDFKQYYSRVIDAYLAAFARMGLEAKVVEASGGVFTDSVTHEFQVLCESGEDTIFYCDSCNWAQNKEIAKVGDGDKCPDCSGKVKMGRSIEVGNIFPLGTWYAEKMGVKFRNEDGSEKPLWFARYGIGTSRLVGTIAEVMHDEHGLVWPVSVAPFKVHLISLDTQNKELGIMDQGKKIYKKLIESEVDVLFDDREEKTPGEKLAEADLLGIPIRIIVSEKTLEKNSAEVKLRSSTGSELIPLDGVSQHIASLIHNS